MACDTPWLPTFKNLRVTSRPLTTQPSLAINPWTGTTNTRKLQDTKRHTTEKTSPVYIILQCKPVSSWMLKKQRSTPTYRPYGTWLKYAFTSLFQIQQNYSNIVSIILKYIQGSQEQGVKFQDPMFTKFQDKFRIFLSVSRGSRHRKCTFFCPHKCYPLKQISIAVLKMLLRHCY